LLKQVFFIGDGLTSGGVQQQFIVPTGATRYFWESPMGRNGKTTAERFPSR